jgi:hypothetical protein
MFRKWTVWGSAFLFTATLAQAATIGVAGDSFDLSNPAYTAKLEESGHTFREISDFGPTSLQGLDAVWLDGFSAFSFTSLDLSSPDLVNFVRDGGILLVQSPGFGAESASEYPFGTGLSVQLGDETTVRIRQPEPWLTGVNGAQLSGWTQSPVPGRFDAIADWQGLADNGTDGNWVTIGRHEGSGAAVYTFQDISRMMFEEKSADALALLDSIVPVPEPSTYALLLLGAAVLPFLRRRQ